MNAGKGDAPRNVGPKFREGYDRIVWGKRKKPSLKQLDEALDECRNRMEDYTPEQREELDRKFRKMTAGQRMAAENPKKKAKLKIYRVAYEFPPMRAINVVDYEAESAAVAKKRLLDLYPTVIIRSINLITAGQKLAAENRAECNKLSSHERERLFKRAVQEMFDNHLPSFNTKWVKYDVSKKAPKRVSKRLSK